MKVKEIYIGITHGVEDAEGAVALVNAFYAQKLMLEANSQEYIELGNSGNLVVAKNGLGEVIGSAAYTQQYPGSIYEFGGWAVADEYQGKGLGTKLLFELFSTNPHGKTIAFANANSAPIFEKLGGVEIINPVGLPEEAFGLCGNCPM